MRSIFKSFPSSLIPTSQVQSQKSEKITPFSNPSLKLAQLEKRLSASIQYAHGVADGINPLTFISDGVVDVLNLKRPDSMNSLEYWRGRENGSMLGMFLDTAGMAGGSGLAGASIQCAATTIGGCLPVAGPGAVGGVGLLGLSAAIMIGHGKNLESAQQSHEIRKTELDSKAKDAEAQAKIKAQELEKQDDAHNLARHGPEISNTDLEKRLTTGIAPDGSFSPSPASTRFKSYEDFLETREMALKVIQEKRGIDLSKVPSPENNRPIEIVIEHPKSVGDGFFGIKESKTPARTYTQVEYKKEILRTRTVLKWDEMLLKWKVTQHFPDLRNWNPLSKSYTKEASYYMIRNN